MPTEDQKRKELDCIQTREMKETEWPGIRYPWSLNCCPWKVALGFSRESSKNTNKARCLTSDIHSALVSYILFLLFVSISLPPVDFVC